MKNIPLKYVLYDPVLLKGIQWESRHDRSHTDIAKRVRSQQPYTVTIIIDNLRSELRSKKEYVQHTRTPRLSLYHEALYQFFTQEYDQWNRSNLYLQWLKKYQILRKKEGEKKEIDEYIIQCELEPRYKKQILQKYRKKTNLMKPRYRIDRERYYRLPAPINHLDWRNPYDNLFIWTEKDKKYVRRGGSGGSSQRESNSLCIFGFSIINQRQPVPSYLFVYTEKNELRFVRRFPSLTVPRYDIGSNYFLPHEEQKKILKGTHFLSWESFAKVKKISCLDSLSA
ncbi:MAG: hypothetical protein HYV32_02630 [Candidatus Kerfeldbacteria bacterium]|nr:hypothetical protein [Candidatus Kerfeldbacteria bacterium]